ncbi:unnamed protein product, partial [Rotaria sp. Silwood1]
MRHYNEEPQNTVLIVINEDKEVTNERSLPNEINSLVTVMKRPSADCS